MPHTPIYEERDYTHKEFHYWLFAVKITDLIIKDFACSFKRNIDQYNAEEVLIINYLIENDLGRHQLCRTFFTHSI